MTRLAVLFAQGFADWECAHPMSSGRAYFGFDIVVATPGGEQVISAGGIKVTPDISMEALVGADFDALVVCGGTIWRSEAAPDISALVGSFSREGKLIAGICDGVLALARTGYLNDREHTGNGAEALITEGYNGQAKYLEGPRAVRSEGLVTAAGVAPVSFMAEVFRALGFGGEELDFYLGMLAAEHR